VAFRPSATQAAAPSRAEASSVVLGRCPKDARPLPAEAVARAADQARIEVHLLQPGFGAVVVTRSDQAPFSDRGPQVKAQCGKLTFHRTVVVDLFFPKMLPSASLSQGTVFVSLFKTGYQVWEAAH